MSSYLAVSKNFLITAQNQSPVEAGISNGGSSWVSSDGSRVYRLPSEKPNSSYATTGVPANFEAKLTPGSRPISNGHLNVTP